MTATQFRRIALSMPEAVEASHMGHPDFRVAGRIFASLVVRDATDWGMVKLTPAQQLRLVDAHPVAFEPVTGGWGRRGATYVRLSVARVPALRDAMFSAWLNTAPKRLVREFDEKAE